MLFLQTSPRLLRNTQIYLQEETGICNTVDPWGGSYYVEKLTHDLVQKSWKHIKEIEELGGMTKAIETGIPKMKKNKARKQRIDSGTDIIVGVNFNKLEQEDSELEILELDNSAVRESQIDRINFVKENRNNTKVKESLQSLTKACKTDNQNLLELAIIAARNRATLGEILVWNKFLVDIKQNQTISGVYKMEIKQIKL